MRSLAIVITITGLIFFWIRGLFLFKLPGSSAVRNLGGTLGVHGVHVLYGINLDGDNMAFNCISFKATFTYSIAPVHMQLLF